MFLVSFFFYCRTALNMKQQFQVYIKYNQYPVIYEIDVSNMLNAVYFLQIA